MKKTPIFQNSSFFTVCYFGYQTFRELRKLKYSNVSLKNKTLQVQLYYALVTQTLIPVILLQLPATILFLSVFVSFDVGEFSGLVAMTIAVYPAIDPLPTMFIVTSYRHGILGKSIHVYHEIFSLRRLLKNLIYISKFTIGVYFFQNFEWAAIVVC